MINELFKPSVAGKEVFNSLLVLSNKSKYECEIPNFIELTNISSIYKNNDIYEVVDDNMSDSNVGGRKGRTIRDNLFIINGIINYAIQEKIDIDINLYDIAKCFDAMWYQETMNDRWDVGVQDDKFALMARMNEKCSIGIKTPVGLTERFEAVQIEMQGTVLGPIKASVQVDTLGRDCYMFSEGLFIYKNCVNVPPLSMCDDVVSVARCGIDSIKTNAIINAKIESKKLEFGPKKCVNIHVGNNSEQCPILKVNDSKLNKKEHETYLGDVISSDGKNEKNIQNKTNQGIGSVSQIFTMLSQVSLGHFHFEIALVMRDSILISKLVASSEIWYDVSKQEYKKLESIDEMFYRRLFNVQISTPKESLYIETGKLPIKFIIKTRRVMYWWHVVNSNKCEVLYKCYLAQKTNPSKGDWVEQLQRDKIELDLDLNDEQILAYTNEEFKRIVKSKAEKCATKYLMEQKISHSKSKDLSFNGFKPAEYLLTKNLTTEEVRTLFQLRTRMIDVKGNFSSAHTNNMWCKLCNLFTETQQHLLECPELRMRTKKIIKFKEVEHRMSFGNLKNQEKVAKVFKILLEARKDILESI